MSEAVVDHPVELRGAVLDLWSCYADMVLVEGRAGTGKTRGLLQRSKYLGEKFPGSRQLWLRQTLKSLRQSVLVTWEEEVLWGDDPWLSNSGATRMHRDSYRLPDSHGAAEIILGGMDTPEKFFSAQFDTIWLWEAREFSYDSVQTLLRSNRNGKIPFQQMVLDTNPAGANHHLNKFFPRGYRPLPEDHASRRIRPWDDNDQIVRLLSRREDNPAFYNPDGGPTARGADYQRKLDKLTGARRRNLRDGDWASEEGCIWETYDEAVHLIDPDKVPPLRWFFASFDKGTRHAGCLQIWGVDGDDAIYRVAEVYRKGMDIDWWAGVVSELDDEFQIKAGVSDHHPEWLSKFNDILSDKGRPRLFRNASKDILTGLQLVNWGFSTRDGGPRIFLVRGAQRYGRCSLCDQELAPACLEEEIGDYIWERQLGTARDRNREKIDPSCDGKDNACDTLRYAAMFKWNKNLESREAKSQWGDETLGELFGHDILLPGRARRRGPSRWRS